MLFRDGVLNVWPPSNNKNNMVIIIIIMEKSVPECIEPSLSHNNNNTGNTNTKLIM